MCIPVRLWPITFVLACAACSSGGDGGSSNNGGTGPWAYLVAEYSGASSTPKIYVTTVASDGHLGSWTLAANAPPAPVAYPNAQIASGKLYVTQGATADVYASTIAADGSLGAFTVDSALPVAAPVGYQGVIAGSTYYVIGDDDCSSSTANAEAVSYASTSGSGALTWSATSTLPVARLHAAAAAPGNGYVYVTDGYVDANACNSGTSDGATYFAKQNADGSLGAWASTAASPPSGFARSIPGVATANGFIYIAGGAINAPSWNGAIYFAKPGSDGTISTWTAATNSISSWVGSSPIMAELNGYLYVGGGFNAFASPQNTTRFYRAALDATTGQPGAWSADTDLPADANTQGHLVFYASH